VLEGNPDLYGPVWIATTVIVILFLTGTINQYLAQKGEEHFAYDFKLLSGAAGLVYGYTAFVPVGLWGVLKWYGSESANLMECACLYGYANLVWIAVSLVAWSPWGSEFLPLSFLPRSSSLFCLCMSPGDVVLTNVSVLNFTVVALGLAASAFFLLRNLYPVLSTTEAKTSKILLIVVFVLHAGFAIAIKVLFFAATSPVGPNKGDKDAGKGVADGGSEDKGGMLRMLMG